MPAIPKDVNHFRAIEKVLRTVEKVITTYALFKPNDRVLVGVSGGPDSVALLHVLLELAPRYQLQLGIAHLNHGLRGRQADADAEFVASLAQKFAVPCYSEKRDIRRYQIRKKLSLEEAARQIRYAFYFEVAEKYGFDKIALGHQANDNAEHVLMYLLRGSGPLGLSGIPPIRGGKIVRPMLGLTRSQIEDYLTATGQQSVSDRSNTDLRFTRNRLRHELLPMLISSYNPRLIETLNRLAEIIRTDEQWMHDTIRPIFDSLIVTKTAGNLSLAVPVLNTLQPAVSRRVIRMAVKAVKGDLRRITFSHIESCRRLVGENRTGGPLSLPGRIRISRQGDELLVYREKKASKHHRKKSRAKQDPLFEYMIPAPDFEPVALDVTATGARLEFTKIQAGDLPNLRHAGQHVAFFDMNRLTFPLMVRSFQPGDRFRPLGMSGTQKVKDFFINRKVPRYDRRRCPLLLNRGKIIWVVGYRIDDSVKLTDTTGDILKAELFLAE